MEPIHDHQRQTMVTATEFGLGAQMTIIEDTVVRPLPTLRGGARSGCSARLSRRVLMTLSPCPHRSL